MRTSTTLAGLMLAMGTFALPTDANGLAARADPFQQGGQQQQQGQFGQAPQQQQGQFGQGYGQGYGQQGQNNRGPGGYYDPNNYQNRPQLDVGCPDCDKYSHHAYENSNTKSTHTHCENGCCKPEEPPCPKPEPPCPKPQPPPCPKPQPKPCEPGCTKPCCQGKYPYGYGEKRA
ncbi:unnamed protein product [Clonostachys byssicola]|uniref:Uncharacterized protein n=1 Tax=Clonostachys byssicola TaxID=160290 RepID=A0A9N9UL19_9HYPO|nr:unnamed protein product [Clonostachys byssicola]